jgi:hypothetical protein
MTPEDRLRQATGARASEVEPSTDALTRIEEKLMHAQRSDNRKRILLGLGGAAAIAVVVIAAVVLTADDDEPVSSGTTSSSSTTTSSTTSTTEGTTTTTFQGVDPDAPIYPDPTTSQRFDEPTALALAFVRDFIGFTDPVVGDYKAGDSRSGEVEVRGFADGAPTFVAVRQLEDDHWYVVGASTDSIRLSTPEVGDTLTSPQPLEGQAYAFEGTVAVRLFADGVQEPIGETFVTGRGDGVLGPFSGEIEFTNDTGATHGVLVLYSESAENGAPMEFSAIRVRL